MHSYVPTRQYMVFIINIHSALCPFSAYYNSITLSSFCKIIQKAKTIVTKLSIDNFPIILLFFKCTSLDEWFRFTDIIAIKSIFFYNFLFRLNFHRVIDLSQLLIELFNFVRTWYLVRPRCETFDLFKLFGRYTIYDKIKLK